MRCPCGSSARYAVCCGRYHAGALAPTAEALMRSRYSAFVVRDGDYLLRTWHPQTRPASIDFDPALTWTGLTVLAAQEKVVEFEAAYLAAGVAGALHEISRFLRDDGAWLYVRGRLIR